MSVPEQEVAPPPRKPTGAATMAAAGSASLAAGRVAVQPTMVAVGVQARAITAATTTVVEALHRFAQARSATIIPFLQSNLVETFTHRTPEEISKLLAREIVRERQFLRRQESRITRDLPKVLSEADIEQRRVAMGKLMAREKRYMAQRERAMSARAHSLVESLDVQDASPDGAYWQLGLVRTHHTAGCIAMSGKFWPWPVLREVIAPPVHPGCACRLLGLHEAVAKGLMKLGPLPDLKDAMLQARMNLALEESILDLVSEDEAIALTEALLEGKKQKRYAKGMAHGGEFMPSVGADLAKAKGAVKKLLTQRGGDRKVYLRGHLTTIPHDQEFKRRFGANEFTSPPGSTNIYRDGELIGVPGQEPSGDLALPGSKPAAALHAAPSSPLVDDALAEKTAAMTQQVEKRLQQPKKGPPVNMGQDGKAAHDALLANGFVVRPTKSKGSGSSLTVAYISKAGHQLQLTYSRDTGKVMATHWKPDLGGGGLFPEEWKAFQAGEEPPGFAPPVKAHASAGYDLGIPGGLFGGKPAGGGSKPHAPSSWKPAPPPPPIKHPALLDAAQEGGAFPNYDHVPLTQRPGEPTAKGPDGERWALRSHGGDPDRVASELLANAIYRKLGAAVPEAGVRHLDDQTPDFASIPDMPIDEAPIDAPPHTRISTGIILRDASGNVTVFEPKNHYMGYQHTFPKGGLEHGLTAQQNAHKELWEETGLHAHITGVVGDYQGQSGISRYYEGVLTGGEVTTGDETWSVKTVTPDEAAKLLNKERDQQILADVVERPLPTGEAPPDAFPGPVGLRPAVAYPFVPGKLERIREPSAELGKHFMADALLANWDVLGKHDDEVVMDDGKPIRDQTSGALAFRADGIEKPYGPVPTEVWSMLGPKGPGFSTMSVTPAQKREQAGVIAEALTPKAIDALVASVPFRDEKMRKQVRSALKQRVSWMERYAHGDESEPEALSGDDAAHELTAMQEGLELFPEQHAALDALAEHASEINAHLFSGAPKGEASKVTRDVVAELDGLLRHVRTDDDVTASYSFDPGELPEGDLVGKTLEHKGYLLMALHPDAKAKGTMRVLMPAGTHALYTRGVEGADTPEDQADVIAARGARLRIVRKTTKSGKVTVEAVLLP